VTSSKCCVMSNGSEIWMKNKKLHREDGPAIVRTRDNYSAYYLEGRQLSFEHWFNEVGRTHITGKKLTYFLLKYNIGQ
jgi:hypothetical protein